MKLGLIYLAGVATMILLQMVYPFYLDFKEWLITNHRRGAWEKSCAEFDALTPDQLAYFNALWKEKPEVLSRYVDDRYRYFVTRLYANPED